MARKKADKTEDVAEVEEMTADDAEQEGTLVEEAEEDNSALFADLLEDEDLEPVEATPKDDKPEEVEEAEEESTPTAEETEEVEEVVAEEKKTKPKGDESSQQVQAETPPQVQAETPQQPVDLNAQYEEFFNKAVEALEPVYVLSEEVAEELDTSPSTAIPKLAARLHMQVLTAAVTQVANMFPQLMQVETERKDVYKQSEERFFNEYPQLKGHERTVLQMAQAVHSMNPNATYEDIAPQVAAMAMVQEKILPSDTAPPEPPAPKPVTPTSVKGGTPRTEPPKPKTWVDELLEEED